MHPSAIGLRWPALLATRGASVQLPTFSTAHLMTKVSPLVCFAAAAEDP